MNKNFGFCASFALFLALRVNCVQVIGNVTTLEPVKNQENGNTSTSLVLMTQESFMEQKPRNGESELNSEYHITTSTTTHRIPPTLLNTKVEFNRETSEKPTKSLKDLV